MAETAKLYYRIGEVARLTGLKPSVLRFWEGEFPELAPLKSNTGQRLYGQQTIDLVNTIKELLYQEKLTIAGAKHRLRQLRNRRVAPDPPLDLVAELEAIKQILQT